ncbi:UvrB/UvrC motif-containing protein [Sporosarcina sp. G11-34]|uniref:UvrB/UvrC motif-containing protein n=1 Tax=Sporosarcina sp. G11-34 TaxID=2849605 RepID=UPI0022A96EC3|nr:UvrB/UvrC motif-containing protein [Sporosarcina sp. G11-34]MCZ2259215.1 UvrB/UvrC motif-containing protein [Sporosarcina sp. G11-34]
MICENCKERPASVILTKGHMGESAEHHLCEKCAFQTEAFHFNPNQEPLSIQQFLSQWFGGGDSFEEPQQAREEDRSDLECPTCKLTFKKFLDIGKFGCATCYDTFREQLPHVFGKLHNGHAAHIGKIPISFNKTYAVKRKIEEIRARMAEAVEAERFEEAASLRDEANSLKEQLVAGGEESDVD